jgi:hypothetical protein
MHGFTAVTLIIDGEDPDQFDTLRADLEAEFDPRPGMELELVERLTGLMWRLRLIPAFEAILIATLCAKSVEYENSDLAPAQLVGEGLIYDAQCRDTLGKLSRHEAGLMNAYVKTLQMLLLLQGRGLAVEATN